MYMYLFPNSTRIHAVTYTKLETFYHYYFCGRDLCIGIGLVKKKKMPVWEQCHRKENWSGMVKLHAPLINYSLKKYLYTLLRSAC